MTAKTVHRLKNRSRQKNGAQDIKSSVFPGTPTRACGTAQRLKSERATGRFATLWTRDLNGQCALSLQKSSKTYLTARSGPGPRPAPAIARSRSCPGKLRFSLLSQIQTANLPSVAPFQVLIFTSFYADMRPRVIKAPFRADPDKDYRRFSLCLTFRDRTFALRFFHFQVILQNVRQNIITMPTIAQPETARLGGKGVAQRLRQSLMRATSPRASRRVLCGASLVYPNNCPKREGGCRATKP